MDERRYSIGGLKAHLVPYYSQLSDRALCGFAVYSAKLDWFGSGSQAERDVAEKLPLCKNCAKKQRPNRPA